MKRYLLATLILVLPLAACDGDTTTNVPLPVCGNGQCELGETVINCRVDCESTQPPPDVAVTLALSAEYIGNFDIQSNATASAVGAVMSYRFQLLSGNEIVRSVVTPSATVTFNVATRPSPCGNYTVEAVATANAGFMIAEQPRPVPVTVPAAECQ